MSADTPLICNISFLSNSNDSEYLRRVLFRKFGDIYLSLEKWSAKLIDIYNSNILSASKKVWISSVTEEILLARITGKNIPDSLLNIFSSIQPFDESYLTVGTLLNLEKACAIFPLKTDKEPSSARIWIFKPDSRSKFLLSYDFLDGAEDIFPSASFLFPILIIEDGKKFDGKSWQLAARLAIKALEEGNPEHLRSLALEWIASGACNENTITSVELGNKLDLEVEKRKWLLPRDNFREIPPKHSRKIIRTASTIESAWNIITGKSHKEGIPLKWSEIRAKCEELHVLIGESINSAVMSVLLLNPPKVVIWTSESQDKSIKYSLQFKEFLQELFESINVVSNVSPLSSNNLQESEKVLFEYFSGINNKYIVFNITSGNRLMSYAVQSLARHFPEIRLIYREFSDTAGKFIYFNYVDFPPYSGTIEPDSYPPTPHNWDFLCSGEKCNNIKDFIRKLLNKTN